MIVFWGNFSDKICENTCPFCIGNGAHRPQNGLGKAQHAHVFYCFTQTMQPHKQNVSLKKAKNVPQTNDIQFGQVQCVPLRIRISTTILPFISEVANFRRSESLESTSSPVTANVYA